MRARRRRNLLSEATDSGIFVHDMFYFEQCNRNRLDVDRSRTSRVLPAITTGGYDAPRRQERVHRQAEAQGEHIEEGYEKRGTSKKEAEARAWATVNKESGGGKKSGSGRGKKENHSPRHAAERRTRRDRPKRDRPRRARAGTRGVATATPEWVKPKR